MKLFISFGRFKSHLTSIFIIVLYFGIAMFLMKMALYYSYQRENENSSIQKRPIIEYVIQKTEKTTKQLKTSTFQDAFEKAFMGNPDIGENRTLNYNWNYLCQDHFRCSSKLPPKFISRLKVVKTCQS